MVKLFALSVFYKGESEARLLKTTSDLQSFSFFQRGTVNEFMSFASKTIVERTPQALRQSIKQDTYMCHVYVRADNLAGVLIADHEYPQRVAHTLVTKILDDFTAKVSADQWPNGTEVSIAFDSLPIFLARYQDPKEADPLTKMQNDLDETKIILKNTIEAVLERGEKLDDMVVKSEKLSMQSKAFYKTAKKTNSCCSFT
ncbi:synaptobrevin homolog YKT6 [Scaptodrosophila lebanonensis]|uniref:Synaptobrevin homolog YKT6 n=1 Tax=Drosophila lebanonensis TaxID=7225 RepID=A0A6J2TSN6_DROLE|nr:synaptobrevin homolog YKT6 [Scaptodrosophila lebanonensis]